MQLQDVYQVPTKEIYLQPFIYFGRKYSSKSKRNCIFYSIPLVTQWIEIINEISLVLGKTQKSLQKTWKIKLTCQTNLVTIYLFLIFHRKQNCFEYFCKLETCELIFLPCDMTIPSWGKYCQNCVFLQQVKVSKFQKDFLAFLILPKKTNEKFNILEELKTPERHLKINQPLVKLTELQQGQEYQ